MKGVQSVWFNEKNNGVDFACGWLAVKYNLFSWALSSLRLSEYVDEMTLVTDFIGAELATQKLGLPYSSVTEDLELEKTNNYLWVLNKIHSYSIQNDPFIHIDTDVYIFNKLSINLYDAPLLAQNFEFDHENYIQSYNEVLKYCHYIPEFVRRDNSSRLTSVNAGIIGGNDILFFKEFSAFITFFLRENNVGLSYCQYDHLNVFVEQFLYKKYAEFKDIPIQYITPKEFGPPCDYQMAEFTQLPTNCNYIHVTNFKRNATVCEQMAQRLWLESPEMYERALSVSKQLEATHHSISFPSNFKQHSYYRTQSLLSHFYTIPIDEIYSLNKLTTLISRLPEGTDKAVLTDVLEFETSRNFFADSLSDKNICEQLWRQYSNQTNELLSLPVELYIERQIKLSPRCIRVESEWDWAEANEFAGQTADRNPVDNLNKISAYYEVVFYYYPHQELIREHLLDTLNILILDNIEKPITISSIIKAVSEQILAYQPQINQQELSNTIINRIRHFLYHGVLDVVL